MKAFMTALLMGIAGFLLVRWYQREVAFETDAVVHLQSEHEHFHFHVDLPAGIEIQPGDTLEILSLPDIGWETHGEVTYESAVRLLKASWLRRNLVKRSSMVEINELVEHP
jgi:hypothetical protein